MINYYNIRPKIQTGDILLFKSDKLIARIIREVDNAEFHHSGIAYWIGPRLFILDAQPEGNGFAYLSNRWNEKNYTDCKILRPTADKKRISDALDGTIIKVEKFRKYDFLHLFQIIGNKYFNLPFKNVNYKYICSELTQNYGYLLGINEYLLANMGRNYFTPQDHLRVKTNLLIEI